MEREQLYQKLQEVKQPALQLSSIREEYRKLTKPYFNVANLHVLIKLFLGFQLFSLIFLVPMSILGIILGSGEVNGLYVVLAIVSFLISVFITIYAYLTLEEKINIVQIKMKRKTHSDRITQLAKEEDEILLYLKSTSLPLSYCYPFAINSFISYLDNYRADNLKECVNLFEQEQQNEKHLNELRTLQQIQEATYEEARSAKNIAVLSFLFRR